MENNTQLDDQLANLTDALLEGGKFDPTEDVEDLGQIVQQLHNLIESDAKPPPAFRVRLTENLNDEWNRQHRQKKTVGRIVQFRNLRNNRYVAAAAVIALVLMIALLLDQSASEPATGTAASADGEGSSLSDLLFVGIGTGTALLVGYAYFQFRRK